jgi:hemoglobin-like flavoprotein
LTNFIHLLPQKKASDMNEKQVLIVKHSWSYVSNRLDDTQALFIKNLYRLLPDIKPTQTKRNGEDKSDEIIRVIHRIVATLPTFSDIDMQKMKTEYASLGIAPADYDSALFAFLMTLEKKASKTWNDEVRESWVFVFASMRQHIHERSRKVLS